MPVTRFRRAREPGFSEIRALELLGDAQRLVESALFAAEVAGADAQARTEIRDALEHLHEAWRGIYRSADR